MGVAHERGNNYFKDNTLQLTQSHFYQRSECIWHKMIGTVECSSFLSDTVSDDYGITAEWPTLRAIQARVRERLGKGSSVKIPSDDLTSYINDGEMDIASKGLCLILYWETDTSTNRRVMSGFIKDLYVTYCPYAGSKHSLPSMSPLMLGHKEYGDNYPRFFFRFDSDIYIEPRPTEAYHLEVWSALLPPSQMEVYNDAPSIPLSCCNLLIDYALFRCFLVLHKFPEASHFYIRYMTGVAEVRSSILEFFANNKREITIPDVLTSSIANTVTIMNNGN